MANPILVPRSPIIGPAPSRLVTEDGYFLTTEDGHYIQLEGYGQ